MEYKVPSHVLVLSGKCPDSSLGYGEPQLSSDGRNIYVNVQKDAVRQYIINQKLSDRFSIDVPISSSIDHVYFGSDKKLVWFK